MTHNSSSCRKCNWCGELEPESGLWERRGNLRSTQTVLCNSCNPNKDVDHGAFVVYNFTMDTEDERVQELISDWIEASDIKSDWKAIKDVGLEASEDGHSRCRLVIEIKDGASHYRLRDLISLKSVIDVANGDSKRNNTRVNIYNYDISKEVLKMKDPVVFAASEGYPELESDCSSNNEDEELSYEEKLDSIRDSYDIAKAMKNRLGENHMPHIPLSGGADALRKARTSNPHKREKKLRQAHEEWKHASSITDDEELTELIDEELVFEVSKLLDDYF